MIVLARREWRERFLLVVLASALTACAGGAPKKSFPGAIPVGVQNEIDNVPFYPQDELQCGPAALATVLGWSGATVSPDDLAPYLFLPERGGTLQPEIKAQARHNARIPYQIPPEPEALLAELAAGHPVLVLQNNGLGWLPVWHYAVVVGMDPERKRVRLRSGTIREHDLAQRTFLNTWRRAGYWGLTILPPDRMPASLAPFEVLSAIQDFSRVATPGDVNEALQAAVGRWPEDPGMRFALANRLYLAGRIDAAEKEYRRVLIADPQALMARNNLAWLLAEQGKPGQAQDLLADASGGTEFPSDKWREAWQGTVAFVECRLKGESNAHCQHVARATTSAL